MDIDQELAQAQLQALLNVPGSLKIICDWCNCGSDKPHSMSDHDRCHACQALPPVTDPAHFVQHDVAELRPYPGREGLLEARSATYSLFGTPRRDVCIGSPAALLTRLQEWRG